MKVLYLVSGIGPPAGWGTEFIQDIIFNLSKKGIEATIINPIYKHTDKSWRVWGKIQEKKHNLRIIPLEAPPFITQNFYLHLALTPLFVTWAAFKLLRKEKFDLIHEFTSTPIILLRSLFIKFTFKIPTVFSLGVFNNTFLGRLFWIKLLDYGNVYCLPSEEIIKAALSMGLSKNKIKFVPPGINLKKYSNYISKPSARKKLGLPGDKFIITYFGSLTKEKGIEDLINAAVLIPLKKRKNILIVLWAIWKGSNEHKKYKNLIKSLKLPHIQVEEKYVDIPKVLWASDLIVLPQQTGHGATIPQISIIETLAAKKPLISTEIIGNRDLFINPKTSLIPPKDKLKLFKRIMESTIKKIKDQNLRVDIKEYELEKVAESYLRIYRQVK